MEGLLMYFDVSKLPWVLAVLVSLVTVAARGQAQERAAKESTAETQVQAKQPPQDSPPSPTAAPTTTDQQPGGVASAAQAPTSERNFQSGVVVLPVDHLFGDWLGLRTRLEDRGITTTLTFVSDMLGNPVGGMRRGFTECDNLGLNMTFDLEKICGVKGGSFLVSMSQRSGANLSSDYIGNTFTTQQVFGRETFQVIDVAYQQKLCDDRVEFRIGRIATGDDFLVSVYDYIFMQNGFDGNPVGIFFNAPGMSAYPNATWGAWLKVRPTERTYIMGGVYNGDIADTHHNQDHGMNWSLHGPLFAIMEVAYQRNQLKGDTGLPGNYKAGIWYDGSAYQDFGSKVLGSDAAGVVPNFRHNNYGFYGLFDQIVIRFGCPDEKILRGIGVTACVQGAPDQTRSQLPFFCTAGILARGIFPERPRDVAGFGVVYGRFSRDLANAEQAAQRVNPAIGVQTTETVLEWTYVFRFREGAFFFQPDLQYIIRPGGTGRIPNALAVGAQVGFNF
jgi:porin